MVDVLADRTLLAGLPFQTLDPVVDEVLSFLVVASVSREAREELVEEAVKVFDNILLPLVKEALDEAALYHIPDYVPMDAFQLIDCLGGDALSEALSWAANTLAGAATAMDEDAVWAYVECTGIDEALLGADERLLASAIVYTFVAAINKMLTSLIP